MIKEKSGKHLLSISETTKQTLLSTPLLSASSLIEKKEQNESEQLQWPITSCRPLGAPSPGLLLRYDLITPLHSAYRCLQ